MWADSGNRGRQCLHWQCWVPQLSLCWDLPASTTHAAIRISSYSPATFISTQCVNSHLSGRSWETRVEYTCLLGLRGCRGHPLALLYLQGFGLYLVGSPRCLIPQGHWPGCTQGDSSASAPSSLFTWWDENTDTINRRFRTTRDGLRNGFICQGHLEMTRIKSDCVSSFLISLSRIPLASGNASVTSKKLKNV